MTKSVETGRRDWRRTVLWDNETLAGNANIEAYEPDFSLVCASVQVIGSGTVALQGSNDGVTYYTLKNTAGTDISFAAAGYAEFSSGAKFIKPSITAGGPFDIIVNHFAG